MKKITIVIIITIFLIFSTILVSGSTKMEWYWENVIFDKNTTFKIGENNSLSIIGILNLNGFDISNVSTLRASNITGNSPLNLEGDNITFGSKRHKIRITDTGLIGIGTINPREFLHIHNKNDTDSSIRFSNFQTTINGGFDIEQRQNGRIVFRQREEKAILFHTNNTERMRITPGGKVMLGNGAINQVISGYEVITATSASDSANKFQNADCTSGKKVIGGGAEIDNLNTNLALHQSRPQDDLSGWRARGVETDAVSANWNLKVWAICAIVD